MTSRQITECDWMRQDLGAEQLAVGAFTRPLSLWIGGVACETSDQHGVHRYV